MGKASADDGFIQSVKLDGSDLQMVVPPGGTFTPKQIQTSEERVKLVYRVKIEIDNPHHELKSNMPADAQILVGN